MKLMLNNFVPSVIDSTSYTYAVPPGEVCVITWLGHAVQCEMSESSKSTVVSAIQNHTEAHSCLNPSSKIVIHLEVMDISNSRIIERLDETWYTMVTCQMDVTRRADQWTLKTFLKKKKPFLKRKIVFVNTNTYLLSDFNIIHDPYLHIVLHDIKRFIICYDTSINRV